MIDNLDQIREVAQKDTFINEITVFVDNLIAQDKTKALYLLKQLFFAPEIHPRVRYMLAQRLGKMGPIQLFQQLLSYFILRKFPDTLSLISALRSFNQPEAVPALVDYYPHASYREQLEIIETLAQVSAPETVEFLSQIFNDQIEYANALEPEQREEIRQNASSALSRKIMRFDSL
ncbi:hypothetical protein COW36_16385 [bacterium (Candidatus Blackallbacteria) CG17_big_fil_post_rev_8_21_14_2_50_48_46]|uniref:HEAT repeat domain-containing protein n=1 Tax=bacterium (Candidatus Blackallbacteria) CG17_big_fil_post_rev_8_21_14_2_50_48_46 TaxID=2014261 RepID=A0A2M7G1N6_9BACT|nr:MAG: hypothetical protein COW64_07055 [bacterium (Candidatus Blackallbacteria) CG18_big_fil_WC_8_21_14_2_50_49_26]PIW15615.1 MAG: hypothetical protein COW36_16385 [bacterium (Candidatus Blackallbacteria) CG17_big_fil_post_rev_8_21_14_2_50_48_46]PIW48099.1 MAG: hypothetical protein COW20_10540 [bacterium (Candidatus Blackallbacteria) CG13_big_fil_rev_8_21_14_2_50_49_14]